MWLIKIIKLQMHKTFYLTMRLVWSQNTKARQKCVRNWNENKEEEKNKFFSYCVKSLEMHSQCK